MRFRFFYFIYDYREKKLEFRRIKKYNVVGVILSEQSEK